jgi:tetratricopeptide (TPR) repeat protein
MVNVKAHGFNNLGYVLAEQGKLNEAMVNYFEALRIKPDFAEAHNNIGSALVVQGKSDEAVGHFSEAVRINPDFEKAHINLGHVFFERGNLDKAFAHFSEALRIKPDYGEAHNGMGAVLTNQGRIDEAIKHFSEAVRIKPGYVKALRNLAWILATQENPAFRNGPKAVEHAERACKITGSKHPLLLDTLAAAYAEAGMFDEARLTAEKAIELAQSAGRAEWARGIEKRLKLYKAGNPYHEGR